MMYGWAHTFAIWDLLRGRVRPHLRTKRET